MATPKKTGNAGPTAPHALAVEVVDPGWLLKMLGLALAIALVCAYVAIGGLFYYGQWQLVLHPTHRGLPAAQGAAGHVEEVRFGEANALRGWWMASDLPSDPTVVMLADGSGEAQDLMERAKELQAARLNVLLFDYRGFGANTGAHPEERTMEQDAEWALGYVTGQRSATRVLVYGKGLGASPAVRLCREHHELAGVILESPDGDMRARAAKDARTHLVPFGLLFHEDFPLADPLRQLETPKLIVSYGAEASAPARMAADPKMLVELASAADEAGWSAALRRFLDTYAAR